MPKPELIETNFEEVAEKPLRLDASLRQHFARNGQELSWGVLRAWIKSGHVLVNGTMQTSDFMMVEAGWLVRVAKKPSEYKGEGRHHAGAARAAAEQEGPKRELIIFSDSQVVVVDKPSGISTVPYDQTEKNTLDKKVMKELGRRGTKSKLHCVHRLDKETTGVLVFARTKQALDHLKSQFRFRHTRRRYEALVHGLPASRTIQSRLVKDRGDGLRGSTNNPRLGREATTHLTLREELVGASLVECKLETGRTHQIRIHLAEAGHPLLGERVYTKRLPGPFLPAPRVMLHARQLGFAHPTTGEALDYESPLPEDFQACWDKLRQS